MSASITARAVMRQLRSLGERLVGFLRFDPATYAALQVDPQTDPQAALQALAMLFVGTVAAAIGAVGFAASPRMLETAVMGELVQWAACVALAYFLGITLFDQPRTASFTQMLPLFGFAQAVKAIGLLGLAPGVGPVAGVIGFALFLVYVIAALRAALGFDVVRAAVNGVSGCVLAYGLLVGAVLTTNSFDVAVFGAARPLAARLPKLAPVASPAISLGRPNVKPPALAPAGAAPQPPGQHARLTLARGAAPTRVVPTRVIPTRPAPVRLHPGQHGRTTPTPALAAPPGGHG